MKITLYRTSLPLAQPYHLSFGTVRNFDSIFCCAEKDGVAFWGEATALPGYSWETGDSIWQDINRWFRQAAGSRQTLHALMAANGVRSPFAATCVNSALEKTDHPWPGSSFSVPLSGILSSNDIPRLEQQLEQQINSGFRTLKVKVHGALQPNIDKLHFLQSALPQDCLLRLDANQGLDFDDACTLLSVLDPAKVELFEQPFVPEQWDKMTLLRQRSDIPLMLDESIWTRADIDRTLETGCANYVKLKLFKHQSIAETVALARYAIKHGLRVVFGNGVQSEPGCYDEAHIYDHLKLTTAAELNGCFKQQSLLGSSLTLNEGSLIVTGDFHWEQEKVVKMASTMEAYELR